VVAAAVVSPAAVEEARASLSFRNDKARRRRSSSSPFAAARKHFPKLFLQEHKTRDLKKAAANKKKKKKKKKKTSFALFSSSFTRQISETLRSFFSLSLFLSLRVSGATFLVSK
jgi:hypothetical protein